MSDTANELKRLREKVEDWNFPFEPYEFDDPRLVAGAGDHSLAEREYVCYAANHAIELCDENARLRISGDLREKLAQQRNAELDRMTEERITALEQERDALRVRVDGLRFELVGERQNLKTVVEIKAALEAQLKQARIELETARETNALRQQRIDELESRLRAQS